MGHTFRRGHYRSFTKHPDSWRSHAHESSRLRSVGVDVEARYAEALVLVGRRVRWAHVPQGEPFRVLLANSHDGSVEIEVCAGRFAPHLFVVAEEQ